MILVTVGESTRSILLIFVLMPSSRLIGLSLLYDWAESIHWKLSSSILWRNRIDSKFCTKTCCLRAKNRFPIIKSFYTNTTCAQKRVLLWWWIDDAVLRTVRSACKVHGCTCKHHLLRSHLLVSVSTVMRSKTGIIYCSDVLPNSRLDIGRWERICPIRDALVTHSPSRVPLLAWLDFIVYTCSAAVRLKKYM